DSLKQDTLIWKVKLADFIQDDVQLMAESVVISRQAVQRWILLATLSALGILITLFAGFSLYRRFHRRP
ncbi:MAG: hypothetical protein ACE5D1_05670, partial [Fidelibacterota bacterium]